MTPPARSNGLSNSTSRQPNALATVVAVRRPTSARPGARGLIHPDGSIEGFVGGSCARPIVVREALRALADGQPRLLRISKEPPSESRRGDGIVDEVMTCHSGGTLEIYVEPHLPVPPSGWPGPSSPPPSPSSVPGWVSPSPSRIGRRREPAAERSAWWSATTWRSCRCPPSGRMSWSPARASGRRRSPRRSGSTWPMSVSSPA